jgi:protein-S-isoprenylcysteine O-methyltransferase Ste14
MTGIHRRSTPPTGADERKLFFTGMARNIVFFCILIAVVFVTAGRLSYWQGWLVVGLTAIQIVMNLIQSYRNMALTRERMRPGPGAKPWDRILMTLYFPLSIALFVVASLDAGRYRWAPELPIWIYPVAVAVYCAGFAFTRWAMQTNRWFSGVVRIQEDRDQQVVRDGPYRLMRHPGYVGIIASFVSAPFILGSLWGLAPAIAVVLLLIVRTALEDATLKEELAGYAEYAEEVKYRLLPGVW